MKNYTARLYTASQSGPVQHLIKIESTSLKKAFTFAKSIALERDARLVDVWENKTIGAVE